MLANPYRPFTHFGRHVAHTEVSKGLRGTLPRPATTPAVAGRTHAVPGPSARRRWDGVPTVRRRDYAADVPSTATGSEPPGGTPADLPSEVSIRPARTADVRSIRALVSPLAEQRVLLQKEAVAYYESVGDFVVAELGGRVIGCGALHVLWEDLGEVRTLAVHDSVLGRGIGTTILARLVQRARALGLSRLFCLTFETAFFERHGFAPIEGQAVEPAVYAELLRSYDEGVAEFLDLERVKPNTLGNTRMLRLL